jgi:hypothetical protein
MADVDSVLQVKMRRHCREIGGIVIHVVGRWCTSKVRQGQ